MSGSELDLDQLSDSERTALEMYMGVTSQEPSEAIPLLRRSEWNVQVGCSLDLCYVLELELTYPRILDRDIQVF
jgi:hypothetical protein